MILTDAELLAQSLAGKEDAFSDLYRRRQPSVYRFALQMTGSPSAAEDVVQETFLALLTQGHRYEPTRGSVAAFLYGVARNFVLRWLERGRPIWDELDDDVAAVEDFSEDLTRAETIEAVRRAVLSLPPAFREAVVLCDLQDASYEEAAVALDCPIGTVRSRLSRGRAMLARKLRPEAVSAQRGARATEPALLAPRCVVRDVEI